MLEADTPVFGPEPCTYYSFFLPSIANPYILFKGPKPGEGSAVKGHLDLRRGPMWVVAATLVALFCAAPGALRAADLPGVHADAGTRLLRAMVGVRARVPADARSATSLGQQREGSGVVIDEDGLVLTIGYLVLEADRTEVIASDGSVVSASVVGYDHESGFGLVRAEHPMAVEPVRFGKSSELVEGTLVLMVSAGEDPVTPGLVVARRPFAGGWEYLLEDAIFTSPPHARFGGAALISADGRLVGIGSLFVNTATEGARPAPGNMFVPIDAIKPILADMIEGGHRANRIKPWLGVFTDEAMGRVFIRSVSPGGPAESAGLRAGDIIMGVGGKKVSDMVEFLRKVWTSGEPGVSVPLDVLHLDAKEMTIERHDVPSMSRYEWLDLRRGL